jgi:hypothetical protein
MDRLRVDFEHARLVVLLLLRLLRLLLSMGLSQIRLTQCNLPRLIVLNPVLVPPFISRGAPRRTA